MPPRKSGRDTQQPSTPTPASSAATTPSRSSSSKRKYPASTQDSGSRQTQVKKSKSSNIVDLISSDIEPVTPEKGRQRDERSASRSALNKRNGNASKMASTANMYSFSSRSSKNNEVVDLSANKSSVSKPMNGTRLFGQLGQGGPKRLVVKNIGAARKVDPQEYFDRKWKSQSAALDSLFRGEDVKILLEELYKDAEHICRQGKAADLFGSLRDKCIAHLAEGIRPMLVDACQNQSPTSALQALADSWKLWQLQLQTIRHIYFYLNQTYLARGQEHGDLITVGTQLFRSEIFSDLNIQETVMPAAVQLMLLDRRGDARNDALLKATIQMFHDLSVYSSHFEPLFVKASEEYFRSWRQTEAEKADLPHYANVCSEMYTEEMRRCDHLVLDHSTRSQLSTMFDQIFVEENVERLSNEDSILDMLEQDLDEPLEKCWSLLHRKGHHHTLGPSYAKFTEQEGAVIVFDEKREEEMVVRLLAFKRKLDRVHMECFHKDDIMGNTLHKSFEAFMNRSKKSQSNWDTDNAKPGEMIAKHIDLLLKGGVSAIPKLAAQKVEGDDENEHDYDAETDNDASIEKHLADALDLFRFVHGKAVFEAFYKKDLARRLLMGRTQSFDAERSMLSRLRNECGANFTHNLESMFKDMDLAREEMKAYTSLLSDRGTRPPVEISVNVLSVAAWPTYPDVPCTIPTPIARAQESFERHFKDKHVGRKLTYKPSLAHCQLRARFPKGTKELVVSGFQAIILLLFNDLPTDATLTYPSLRASTSLPDADLKRTLQSLACGRYRVLTKTPRGRDVSESDVFAFNDKFTDPRFRVKINQIQLKETKEENKETHQRVAADRHYETQAAIVRILKSRKRIGHNELIVEVIKATRSRGVLDQSDIKKNIEKLIEKDYLERDEEVRGYSYLA